MSGCMGWVYGMSDVDVDMALNAYYMVSGGFSIEFVAMLPAGFAFPICIRIRRFIVGGEPGQGGGCAKTASDGNFQKLIDTMIPK